ncbi:SGNH/GDSL hydrolase family protein [Streptoverticillium reticulum]|uniref:SGNH/GDSL hydrolase family protein n=1 Tax=Streptoverticillium reticulum TaxID=1433415 RepID=UPI0039BF9A5D
MSRAVPTTAICALLAASLVTVAAPAHAESAGTYVALGDSYAAGAGVPSQSAGLCMRSSRNYGHMVAETLKREAATSSYKDVTCAAAKVDALTTTQTDVGIPVNGPQLDAVTRDTGLVTLTIGGNNLGTSALGFVDVVATCAALSVTNPFGAPCRDHYGDTLDKRLDAAAPQLAAALQRIHAKAPRAKVLVAGYPAVLPDDARTCLFKMPATTGDLTYLRSVIGKLNDMVSTTAVANGAAYVDTLSATKGHDACSSDRWIEGILPTKPALSLHPNATGERVMAEAVLKALRG